MITLALYNFLFLTLIYQISATCEPDYGPRIDLAYDTLWRISNHSWEFGTLSEVILEYKGNGKLSVFGERLPLPTTSSDPSLWQPKPLFDLIDPILARRASNATTIIEADGAAGDPASLGVGLYVLHNAVERSHRTILDNYRVHTGDHTHTNRTLAYDYLRIANQQYDHLINTVPRDSNGTISQRESEVQYWSDFMFMVPPFLAYRGAMNLDYDTLELVYRQCYFYREKLLDRPSGTWRHILGGSWNETGLWSTGNGWTAMGLMRVRQTMESISDQKLRVRLSKIEHDLELWISEIIVGAFKFQSPKTKLLPNHYDRPANETYDEVSGSALITAAAYRLINLNPKYLSILPIKKLEETRQMILQQHINIQNGAVSQVVDPLDWNAKIPFDGSIGKQSPEGQAFVILLFIAWKAFMGGNLLDCY